MRCRKFLCDLSRATSAIVLRSPFAFFFSHSRTSASSFSRCAARASIWSSISFVSTSSSNAGKRPDRISSARAFQISPAGVALLPSPTAAPHLRRPLQSVERPPRSLLLSRCGMTRSRRSRAHACRRKVPSSSHSTLRLAADLHYTHDVAVLVAEELLNIRALLRLRVWDFRPGNRRVLESFHSPVFRRRASAAPSARALEKSNVNLSGQHNSLFAPHLATRFRAMPNATNASQCDVLESVCAAAHPLKCALLHPVPARIFTISRDECKHRHAFACRSARLANSVRSFPGTFSNPVIADLTAHLGIQRR